MSQKGGRSATLERWADRVEDVMKPHACGLTHAQIADKAGMSLSTTSKALACSAKRGGVLKLNMAQGRTIWFHYDFRAAVHARKAAVRAAAMARDRARAARSRGEEPELEIGLSAFERPIVHRIVPAASAIRLRPKGPASVWGLAA